ncbi:MAG: hypothetical protein GY862_19565 [Gammaproteobacteria bacterium]|nr:hypothetical protein [Gammaproteobacteria bacterium]
MSASVARVVGWVEARPDSRLQARFNHAETCLINDARLKVMGFGAGKTMPKTTIGARLYPSYNPGYACLTYFPKGLPALRKRSSNFCALAGFMSSPVFCGR